MSNPFGLVGYGEDDDEEEDDDDVSDEATGSQNERRQAGGTSSTRKPDGMQHLSNAVKVATDNSTLASCFSINGIGKPAQSCPPVMGSSTGMRIDNVRGVQSLNRERLSLNSPLSAVPMHQSISSPSRHVFG